MLYQNIINKSVVIGWEYCSNGTWLSRALVGYNIGSWCLMGDWPRWGLELYENRKKETQWWLRASPLWPPWKAKPSLYSASRRWRPAWNWQSRLPGHPPWVYRPSHFPPPGSTCPDRTGALLCAPGRQWGWLSPESSSSRLRHFALLLHPLPDKAFRPQTHQGLSPRCWY